MRAIRRLVGLFVAYHAATLVAYIVPLAAARLSRRPRSPRPAAVGDEPRLIVIAPCRHAAESIPGFAAAIRTQDYPADRVRILFAVDRDDAADPSVAVARAVGAEARERFNPTVKTKGAALNAVFADLRGDDFDGVVVFDVDARPEPMFLSRVAAHFRDGACVLQAAAESRNTDGTPLTRISELGQTIARMYQRGRAALGWPGLLSGGAMAFRRDALERLDWQTSTRGHLSDDGELNLRCCLADIPVRYAPDLRIFNDVPANPRELRLQRRRWSAGYQELAVPYFLPFLKRALGGHWRVVDCAVSLLFASTFSLTFLAAGALTSGLGAIGWRRPAFRPLAAATGVPFVAHGLLYFLVLRAAGPALNGRVLKELPTFLAMRTLAFFDGFALAFRRQGRNPIPSRHRADAPALTGTP